jgi:hypothetical protein
MNGDHPPMLLPVDEEARDQLRQWLADSDALKSLRTDIEEALDSCDREFS